MDSMYIMTDNAYLNTIFIARNDDDACQRALELRERAPVDYDIPVDVFAIHGTSVNIDLNSIIEDLIAKSKRICTIELGLHVRRCK